MKINIKKLGISSLIVISLSVGLYWYSYIEAHPKSVVSSESDINKEETEDINDSCELADDEKIENNDENIDDKKISDNVKLNNENLSEDKVQVNESKVISEKELTIEEAKNLLIEYNSKVDYVYQGDETMFKDVLQEEGYEGYLFLPNVDTDIGFFVDKHSGDIYKFHPSGYMEKI